MTIPSYATSMVSNYRAQFKTKYGRDTTLDNDAIWKVCNEIFDDNDTDAEMAARVEVMKEREQ